MIGNKSKRKRLRWTKENECWRCISHALDSSGYPRFSLNQERQRIGRWIALKRFDVPPTDLEFRHTCDHAWCINPAHILSGSHADNMRDRVIRGRTRNQWTGKL